MSGCPARDGARGGALDSAPRRTAPLSACPALLMRSQLPALPFVLVLVLVIYLQSGRPFSSTTVLLFWYVSSAGLDARGARLPDRRGPRCPPRSFGGPSVEDTGSYRRLLRLTGHLSARTPCAARSALKCEPRSPPRVPARAAGGGRVCLARRATGRGVRCFK